MDIPELEIKGNKIVINKISYELIMCYLCPICEKPIIAYWKIPPMNNRVTPDVIGRALRDSGFGGFRFFSTDRGQGFEFDPEKDPRNRHQHGKEKERYYGGYGAKEYDELWHLFIKLNPIFSMNDLFKRLLDPYDNEFAKNYQFISTQAATDKFFKEMKNRSEIFKISSDKMKHGKDLFYFNIVQWEQITQYGVHDVSDRVKKLREWFGDELMGELHIGVALEEDEGDYEANSLFRSNPYSPDEEELIKKYKRDGWATSETNPKSIKEIKEYALNLLDVAEYGIRKGHIESARRILWRALGAIETLEKDERDDELRGRYNKIRGILEHSKAMPVI